MGFIPVPDVANVFIEFLLPDGVRAGNSIWVQDLQAGIGGVRVTQLATLVEGWVKTQYQIQQSNQVSFVRLNVRDMTIENGSVLDKAINPATAGSQASPALPASVSYAVSFRTGVAGRSFRGRAYYVGLSEIAVSGNYVNAPNAQAIVNQWENLRSVVLAPNDFNLVVVSRRANGAPRVTGVATTVTSIFAVDFRVDTQRRRLPGEGS